MMERRISLFDERPVRWIAAFVFLSWVGEFLHNRIELPGLGLLSQENSITALITAALFLLWWFLPSRKWPAILLFSWGMLHLLGGAILSVIPFSFLPFYPEQTLTHYLAHHLYGLAQIPLIIAMLAQLRKRDYKE
jgi:hypothetical protein